jgi:hypothetical protein
MGNFGTFLFVLIAVLDGALLSYLYSKAMPWAVRLCVGACTGFGLLATVGFAIASLAGSLSAGVVWLSLAVVTLPAIFVIWSRGRQIQEELAAAIAAVRRPSWTATALTLFYLVNGYLLNRVFAKAVFFHPDGLYTGVTNNYGDLPLHLQIIFSFSQGRNFPTQDPIFSGVRFAYPFLADLMAAMIKQAGASLIAAIWLENMVLAVALLGLLHYLTSVLTKDKLAGFLAPLLVLFSGGLGWYLLLSDARTSDSGLLGLVRKLPHDYTILMDPLFRWGNSFTSLFVTQRSILMGAPIVLVILLQWWRSLSPESEEEITGAGVLPRMLAAGIMAGMLPLIHAHSFMVVMMVAGCLVFLFPRWRAWLAFFVPALLIAAPEMWWTTHGSGVRLQAFLGWSLGWDHGDTNVLWFWFVNTGAFIPLLLAAVLTRKQEQDLVPSRLLRFYTPFVLCFIIPNLLKLAPWIWDNIKVLFYWYLASVPLVALLLASWFKTPGKRRWAAAGLLLSLTLAGALDLTRVVTAREENREFDSDGIAIAQEISRLTAPHAVVLHAPTHNTPVFLTGRRSVLGYPGHAWTRGLDPAPRESDIHLMYAGSPQAMALLRSYDVEYAVVGPQERSGLTVNDVFWNQFPVIAQVGEYRLYRTEPVR